ncbi:hypothetical protein MMC31_002323 [Peltigera leucophlebia]|nr:hypothetical protein [Peltigera leucophlebia]
MVSRKRTFEDDEALARVNPAGLVSRKFAKTKKLAGEFAGLNAEASTVSTMAKAQVGPVTPAASVTPTSTTLPRTAPTSTSVLALYEQLSSAPPENKGKRPVPREPPDTAEDLRHKKELWRAEWDQEVMERIEAERMDAAWTQREICEKAEKKALKNARKQWDAQAKKKMEEEIGKQIEVLTKWWQDHYEKDKRNCEEEMAKKLQQHVESFKRHLDEALAAAQKAEAYAETQVELGHRVWDSLKSKTEEVEFLQDRLDAANESLTKGLAQEHQNKANALLHQEVKRLTAELTNAQPNIEDARKARNDAVEEIADKAEEIKKLKERLDVVTAFNRDLEAAGVKKDQKLEQQGNVPRGSHNPPEFSQKLNQVPKEADGESQAITQNPKSTNTSNLDDRLFEKTLAKSGENERLVRELRRKLAKQVRDSDSKLKELKTKMTSSLKEAMEEKDKMVQKLAMEQNSEELMKLKNEHRVFKQRNQDMARKAIEAAANIADLTAQANLLRSAKEHLLHESTRLKLLGNHDKAKLVIESNLLSEENSRVLGLSKATNANNEKLGKMVKARDAKIKALEKIIREEEETILMLRQWDAESGVLERDQRIERLESDEKEYLEHIEKLEQELLKYRNVSLIERVSGWVFGTPSI